MACDTSEIPAAYFTTFAVSDLNGLVPRASDRAQKRNRRVFVCIPCHRKKLKCDKALPCSRCLAAGCPDDCSYQPPPTSSSSTNANTKSGTRKERQQHHQQQQHGPRSGSGYAADRPPRHDVNLNVRGGAPSPTASLDSHCSSSSLGPWSSSLQGTPGGTATRLGSMDDEPLNGTSHWSRIACELPEAAPYLAGTEPRWQQRYHQVKSLKCLFAHLDDNPNFPFGGSAGSSPPLSKDQILHALPPVHIIDTLVANYLDTFGATHSLLHPSQLSSQLRYDFLSSVSDEWLAHFCMALALGAETAHDYLFSGMGQSAASWAGLFLRAAQASFARSPYMAAPSLLTVRTLCMMLIARLVEMPASGGSRGAGAGGCGGYAPLVSLMAFTVRTAKLLQLQRSGYGYACASEGAGAASPADLDSRRRIWVTVRLLDLETALRAGTTLQSDAGEAEPPPLPPPTLDDSMFQAAAAAGFGSDQHGSSDDGSSYQDRLALFLPLLAQIVNTVNAPAKPRPAPNQIAAWDARVRQGLAEMGALVSDSSGDLSITQFQHLEIVTHRVLLALHHADMFSEAPSPRSQRAQAAIVESASVLLRTQSKWTSSMTDLAGRCASTCTNLTTAASVISVEAPFSMLPTVHAGDMDFHDPFAKPAPAAAASAGADMADLADMAPVPVAEMPEMLEMPELMAPLHPCLPPVSGQSSPPAGIRRPPSHLTHTTAWLLDLCHDDFAAALMYMILALRAMQDQGGTSYRRGQYASGEGEAALAVHSSYEIVRDGAYRSVGHFKEFFGIAILFACFRGLGTGDLLVPVVEAANDVEQVIVAGRRSLMWAAEGYTTPNEAYLYRPLVAYGGM